MFVAGIRSAIQQQQPAGANSFWESKTDQLGTNFFFVSLTDEQANTIRNNPLVKHVYVPMGPLVQSGLSILPRMQTEGNSPVESNPSDGNSTINERSALAKRAEIVVPNEPDTMVLLSWPPGTGPVPEMGEYKFDSSAGEGTYVYSCDWGADPSHSEFSEILSFTPLFPGPFPVSSFMETDTNGHGTKCLSKAVGKTVGVARKARVVATVIDLRQSIYEHFLDALALIHEDIYVKGRGTKSVVNFSISIVADRIPAAYQDTMGTLTPSDLARSQRISCPLELAEWEMLGSDQLTTV